MDPNNVAALNAKADNLQNKGDYDEAISYYEKTKGLDGNNVYALEQLHFIYSRQSNQLGKAVETTHKLLNITNNSPQVKTFLAEDLIKSGKYNEGRAVAQDALKNANVKRQLILKFLIISSYFLDGRRDEGEKELGNIVDYYQNLEGISVKIEDEELDFRGFRELVNKKQIGESSKSTMYDLINLLQGKLDENKIVGMVSKFAKTTIKSTAAKNRRLKHYIYALIPLVIIGPLIGLYLTVQPPNFSHADCANTAGQNLKSMPLEGKKTHGVEIDARYHHAYILNQGNTISIVDTCTDKVLNIYPTRASMIVPDVNDEVKRPNDFIHHPIESVASLINDNNTGFGKFMEGKVDFKSFVNGNLKQYKLYMVNEARDDVSVAKIGITDQYEKPIRILHGNHIVSMQIDKGQSKLYVLDRNSTVYVIDTDTDKQLPQKITVLSNPNDMVLDNNTSILYVKYDNSSNISAINLKGLHGQKNPVPIKLIKLDYKPGAMALSDDRSLHFTVGPIVSRERGTDQQIENGLYKLNKPYTIFDADARAGWQTHKYKQ